MSVKLELPPSVPESSIANPGTVQDESKSVVDTAAAPAPSSGLQATENPQLPAEGSNTTVPTGSLEEGKDAEPVDKIPDDATETVYLNNLNEKVKLPGRSYLNPSNPHDKMELERLSLLIVLLS
jgi:hypothetical protein